MISAMLLSVALTAQCATAEALVVAPAQTFVVHRPAVVLEQTVVQHQVLAAPQAQVFAAPQATYSVSQAAACATVGDVYVTRTRRVLFPRLRGFLLTPVRSGLGLRLLGGC